jgi:hypothetical protein
VVCDIIVAQIFSVLKIILLYISDLLVSVIELREMVCRNDNKKRHENSQRFNIFTALQNTLSAAQSPPQENTNQQAAFPYSTACVIQPYAV